MNIGGVFVALLLAYFSHDPDKDFDLAGTAVERGRATIAKMHAAYLKKRKKIIERFKPDLTGNSGTHGDASKAVVELKTRLGMSIDEDDRFVIDELDRLAEDSEHAEEAGVIDQPRQAEKPPLREVPRKAS